jgi:hypothetical protein
MLAIPFAGVSIPQDTLEAVVYGSIGFVVPVNARYDDDLFFQYYCDNTRFVLIGTNTGLYNIRKPIETHIYSILSEFNPELSVQKRILKFETEVEDIVLFKQESYLNSVILITLSKTELETIQNIINENFVTSLPYHLCLTPVSGQFDSNLKIISLTSEICIQGIVVDSGSYINHIETTDIVPTFYKN